MSDHEWSRFWWENITGPNFILTKIAGYLLDNTGVVFVVPSDLPWRSDMRHILAERIRERSDLTDVLLDFIDAEDDYPVDVEVGTFLLDKYGQCREIRNGFRGRGRKSIQEYLKKNEVLKNKVVWVKGLTGLAAKNWMEFCRNYMPDGIEKGMFVLEVHDVEHVAESSNLKSISYEDNISANDIQVFNEFVLNDRQCLDELWINYIATVSACLCDRDAEISELLIKINDFKSESPECGLQRIAEMPDYQRRGGDENSGHILALVRHRDEEEIHRRIWAAQVKSLFPLIEFERNKFVKRYKREIENSLQYYDIEQYKEKLVYAEDVELGTLVYMMTLESGGYKALYIPYEEREKIHFLHKCRNNIAHAKLCTPEEIGRIIMYSCS